MTPELQQLLQQGQDHVRTIQVIYLVLFLISLTYSIWLSVLMHRFVVAHEQIAVQAAMAVAKFTSSPGHMTSDQLKDEAARRVAILEGKPNPFNR